MEFILQVFSTSFYVYFSDYWHYIDAVVVAQALINFILLVLDALDVIAKSSIDPGIVSGIS